MKTTSFARCRKLRCHMKKYCSLRSVYLFFFILDLLGARSQKKVAPILISIQNPFTMSDKLCLQWNDFRENITTAFRSLRHDNDLSDVTLVCEDGEQVEAHKVILSASSPFFQKILKRNKHPNPMIFRYAVK